MSFLVMSSVLNHFVFMTLIGTGHILRFCSHLIQNGNESYTIKPLSSKTTERFYKLQQHVI